MRPFASFLATGAALLAAVHASPQGPPPGFPVSGPPSAPPSPLPPPPVVSFTTVVVVEQITLPPVVFTTTDYVQGPTAYITVTTTSPEYFTETTPTTVVSVSPTTITDIESFTTTKVLTATEIISEVIVSSTEAVSITLCESRIANPTYTAAVLPLPTDYTWGCPPGYLCKPSQSGCNFEVGLPADDFYCSPDECIPAAPFVNPQLWDINIYGNSSPATDPNLKYSVVGSYFDMNPTDFGLDYTVFVETEVITYTYTTTILEQPTPALVRRQAETNIPGTCFPWCNDCLIEAQSVGKTPALCAAGSTFETDLGNCQACVAYHKNDKSADFVKIAPQFQQFINYCAGPSSTSTPPAPAVTVTTTVSPVPVVLGSSTLTTVSGTVAASSLESVLSTAMSASSAASASSSSSSKSAASESSISSVLASLSTKATTSSASYNSTSGSFSFGSASSTNTAPLATGSSTPGSPTNSPASITTPSSTTAATPAQFSGGAATLLRPGESMSSWTPYVLSLILSIFVTLGFCI